MKLYATVFVVGCAAVLAHAQPNDKDLRLSAARDVSQLMLPREQWERTLDVMTKQIAALSVQATANSRNKALPADYQQRLKKMVRDTLPYEEVVEWRAQGLATHFTLDELHQLSSFYRTPVGGKFAALLPEMSEDMMQKARTAILQKLPTILQQQGDNP